MNFGEQRLLIIAPHPDDEVLGCGGLISKVKRNNGKVHVLIMCVGDSHQYGGKSEAKVRITEMEKVMRYLKIDSFHLALPGNKFHLKLDMVPQKDLIDVIESGDVSIASTKPTIVCIPYRYSTHQDHVAVSRASFTACRPVGSKRKIIPPVVLSYEQPETNWTRTRFHPNFYVDISDHLNKKVTAISKYSSQIRAGSHPRTIENIKMMAETRGAEVGVSAAEAYECHRFLT